MLAFVMEFIGETVSSIPFVFLDPGWSKGFSLIRTIRVKDKAVSVKIDPTLHPQRRYEYI